MQDIVDAALQGQETEHFEIVICSKDDQEHVILLNATPRRGRGGEVMGVIGVGQDITEMNRQKQEAVRIASELQNIIHSAAAPIIAVDRNNRITEWNNRVEEMTGINSEQAAGKDLLLYVRESCATEVAHVLKEVVEERKSKANLQVLLDTRSQGYVVLLLSCTPRLGSDGMTKGAICIGQDITEMKELDVKKSNMAAAVTHELRSPLHGIIGLSEQLIGTAGDGIRKKQLTLIKTCAQRLLDVVTNIMTVSTLVQKKKTLLARDPVQIRSILEEVRLLCATAVDKANRPVKKPEVQLVFDIPEQLPIIEADAHRCMQMLYNLVTNALKYTVQGEVHVTAAADDEKKTVTLEVSDTGIGIGQAARERIFLPFEQEDQSDSRRYEGLGLGLAISRAVAEKHGGTLTVESEVGKGSSFKATLPYEQPEYFGRASPWDKLVSEGHQAPTEAETDDPLDRTRNVLQHAEVSVRQHLSLRHVSGQVLVVDDDQQTRHYVRDVLQRTQAEVVECASSHECMSLLHTGDMKPALIIMDVVLSDDTQVFGRPLANFFSDDPGFTVAKSFDRARQGEEVQPVAASMIVKGGGVQRLMLHPALRGDVGEDVICIAHEAEAVKESPVFDEEDFNAVLDKVVAAVPTPSLLLDVAGKVTAWNESAEKLSGFKQDEVLGRPLQELICGDGDKLDSMIVDTLDGNETFGFECELLTKSGNISILEMNATARYDASGDAVGVIIMAKDRSDPDEFSSKPQVEMWQAEQRMFFETSLRPIFTIDGDGKIQDWNRKVAEITGFTEQEATGQPVLSLGCIVEEDMEEMSCALRRVYGGEEEVKTELALRDLKGNEHEVEIRVRPRCAADGSVQGALVIGCHNMDLLLAQHQRAAEDMVRLLRGAQAPVIAVDMCGELIEWNDKVAAITGFSRQEVLGRPFLQDFVVEGVEVFEAAMAAAIRHGQEDLGEFELMLRTKSDGKAILRMSGATFRDTQGEVGGVVACGQDLTSIRNSMQEATRTAEDLQRLIETAHACIVGIDPVGNVNEWNHHIAQLSGWSKEDTMGKRLVDNFVLKEDQEDVADMLHRALNGEKESLLAAAVSPV